jgi:single-strand DNA-binding protein
MSTTITGKLNKAATQFQAGESTGFGVRLGVKYRDPKTKQEDWCNYSAVIFAKSPGQIQFYQSALVEGSVVEVSAEQLSVESFQGNNGPILSINMLNARLGYVHTGQQQGQGHQQPQGQQQRQQPQQAQRQPAPQGYQQGRQQAQGQQPQQMTEPQFDDDLPF